MSEEMYKEIILDHYKNPRNKGVFPDAEVSAEDYNPVCGDRIRIDIIIADDKVSDVKFDGEGCAISQASASILTDMLIDKSIDEILKLDKDDILKALGTPVLGPARIKCALLSLKVMKLGTYSYIGKDTPTDSAD